jgi:hypothetical protein
LDNRYYRVGKRVTYEWPNVIAGTGTIRHAQHTADVYLVQWDNRSTPTRHTRGALRPATDRDR